MLTTIAIGKIVHRPKMELTPGEVRRTEFDIEIRDGDANPPEVKTLHCEAWRGLAIVIAKEAKKDSLVWLSGKLRAKCVNDKIVYTLEVQQFENLATSFKYVPEDSNPKVLNLLENADDLEPEETIEDSEEDDPQEEDAQEEDAKKSDSLREFAEIYLSGSSTKTKKEEKKSPVQIKI